MEKSSIQMYSVSYSSENEKTILKNNAKLTLSMQLYVKALVPQPWGCFWVQIRIMLVTGNVCCFLRLGSRLRALSKEVSGHWKWWIFGVNRRLSTRWSMLSLWASLSAFISFALITFWYNFYFYIVDGLRFSALKIRVTRLGWCVDCSGLVLFAGWHGTRVSKKGTKGFLWRQI